jgi:hypothetical protein
MSYLARIAELNTGVTEGLWPFVVAGQTLSHVKPGFAEHLLGVEISSIAHTGQVFAAGPQGLLLAPELDGASPAVRSRAIASVLGILRDRGLIKGWRDEMFPMTRRFGASPALLVERAAMAHFGGRGYGVHVNGYVQTPSGLALWVAERSADKPTWPGLLDQIVAGGQPAGLGLRENMIKECAEEANIGTALASAAHAVGTVSYCLDTPAGIRPDLLFVFDLFLPRDFAPRNTDGEVAGFELWPVEQVAQVVQTSTRFKPNCALVVIDFLVRHGVIDPEHPDYELIVSGLRV